jgi:hypothetical protein
MSTLDNLFEMAAEAYASAPSDGPALYVNVLMTTTDQNTQSASLAVASNGYVQYEPPSVLAPLAEASSSVTFAVQLLNPGAISGDTEEQITITKHPGRPTFVGDPINPPGYSLSVSLLPDKSAVIDGAGLIVDDTNGVVYGSQGDNFVTLAAFPLFNSNPNRG